MTARRAWIGCALVVMFACLSARAQGDELDDLRARLERVEQQNQELRDRLDRVSNASVADAVDEPKLPVDQADTPRLDDLEPIVKDAKPKEADKKKPDDAPKIDEPAEPEWYEVGSDLKMSATWKHGVEIETKNKDFRFHVGGRTQIDMGWYAAEHNVQFGPGGVGPVRDGINFRRGRLRADGVMWDQIEWVVEYDFVNSGGGATFAPAPTDGYFTFTKLPWVGNLRLGLQKEPFGFEHLVSSRFLSFMERSFNQDLFYGGFNNGFSPGITIFDNYADEHGTVWLGLYKTTTNAFQFNTGGGEYAATGRLTYLPWYVDEGRGLIHLGASLRHAGMDDGTTRYRTRGPIRSGFSGAFPVFANTGVLQGFGQNQLNTEFAAVFGPLNFQADYMLASVDDAFRAGDPAQRTVIYHGGYIEGLCFLTGEHRAYNKKSAVFERVVPTETFFLTDGPCGPIWGRGAWQVGVRYNYADLNDKGLNGGILNDVTAGLNWFLNPNLKLQWNYSVTHRESPDGRSDGLIQGVGMRLAHDF